MIKKNNPSKFIEKELRENDLSEEGINNYKRYRNCNECYKKVKTYISQSCSLPTNISKEFKFCKSLRIL